MPEQYLFEQIENWAADFVASEQARPFSGETREHAGELLAKFLCAACDRRRTSPSDLEEADIRYALVERVARLPVPPGVHRDVPALVAAFAEHLGQEGRLADSASHARFVRALAPAYREASGTNTKPHVRPASKLSPNEPCPCGSGKKFKKCCAGLLG